MSDSDLDDLTLDELKDHLWRAHSTIREMREALDDVGRQRDAASRRADDRNAAYEIMRNLMNAVGEELSEAKSELAKTRLWKRLALVQATPQKRDDPDNDLHTACECLRMRNDLRLWSEYKRQLDELLPRLTHEDHWAVLMLLNEFGVTPGYQVRAT